MESGLTGTIGGEEIFKMIHSRRSLMAAMLLFSVAFPFQSYSEEGGCVYNRSVYPEKSQMCQGGSMMECDEGAWSSIGFCDQEAMPEPVSSGGDSMEPSED